MVAAVPRFFCGAIMKPIHFTIAGASFGCQGVRCMDDDDDNYAYIGTANIPRMSVRALELSNRYIVV
jgi:hypothetical protein